MGWGNLAYGIERVGDSYVVGGTAINLEGRHHMFMALYDQFGERIHETSLPEIEKILFLDSSNEIVIDNDKAYWSSVGTGSFIIYEYDYQNNLFSKIDTLETHETDFYGLHYSQLGSGSLITGFFTKDFTNNDFGIYKLEDDSLSTLRVADPQNSSYGARIFQYTDSTYVVTSEYDDCDLCGRLRIYIVDDDLNVLDTITSNNDYRRWRTRDAILDEYGNVVSCSLHSFLNEDSLWNNEPLITRINIHDRTEWDTKIGVVENEHRLESGWWGIIEATDDDGYVLAGSARIRNDTQDFSYATLAKISVDGDSVWYRRYSTIDSTHAHHQFRDVTTTPDGGYMAVGYDDCHAPLVGCDFGFRILLLKTDKDGLIEPDSISSVVTIDEDVDFSIMAYPNPVIKTLYIQHSAKQNLNYSLLNSQGQLLHSFRGGISDETFIIDVSSYTRGTYFLAYKNKEGQLLGAKKVMRL